MKLQTTQKDGKLYGKLPDTGWVDITLQNGVTARDSTNTYKPQIRRIGNIVFLKGQIKIPANINVLATIPIEFRPSYEVRFPSVVPNCWLGPAGEIRMSPTSSVYDQQAINTSWILED